MSYELRVTSSEVMSYEFRSYELRVQKL